MSWPFSYCSSLQFCDFENCGTCVAGNFSPCNSNDDCNVQDQDHTNHKSVDTRPKSCMYSNMTKDMRCLPTCPSLVDNTIIADPHTYGTTKGEL